MFRFFTAPSIAPLTWTKVPPGPSVFSDPTVDIFHIIQLLAYSNLLVIPTVQNQLANDETISGSARLLCLNV